MEEVLMHKKPLGIGIIGGGFIARFHIRSWVGVRDADILGIFDPDAKRAREACALVEDRSASARPSPTPRSPPWPPIRRIDALWICAPNYTRVEVMEEIAQAVAHGQGRSSSASPARSRSAATSAKPGRCSTSPAKAQPPRRLPREPGLLPGRRPRQGDRLGPRRGPLPARPTSPGRPRSTAARTCPGSGKARSRAAASSTT